MDDFIPGSSGNVYHDSAGNECGLYTAVTREPEWACSRIREGEKAIAETQRLKEKVARYEAIFDCLETTTMPASKFKDYALSVIAHGPIEE